MLAAATAAVAAAAIAAFDLGSRAASGRQMSGGELRDDVKGASSLAQATAAAIACSKRALMKRQKIRARRFAIAFVAIIIVRIK